MNVNKSFWSQFVMEKMVTDKSPMRSMKTKLGRMLNASWSILYTRNSQRYQVSRWSHAIVLIQPWWKTTMNITNLCARSMSLGSSIGLSSDGNSRRRKFFPFKDIVMEVDVFLNEDVLSLISDSSNEFSRRFYAIIQTSQPSLTLTQLNPQNLKKSADGTVTILLWAGREHFG